MAREQAEIRWADRLRKDRVRRLYETDAQGIYDEELIDDVGFALHARCQSFLEAMEARRGRAKCHGCDGIIEHRPSHSKDGKARLLRCGGCGWEVTWGEYFASMQHRQLCGEDLEPVFREYMERFPRARTARQRMLLIDWLIHSFHYNARTGPRRPAAVNLIAGSMHEVVEFLDSLSYGERSTPGTRDSRREWRRQINFAADAWRDDKLRRRGKG